MAKTSGMAKRVYRLYGCANTCLPLRALCVVLVVGFCPCLPDAFGQWGGENVLQESFDSDQPSWEMLYIDSGGKVSEIARVSGVAISGKSETWLCEFVNPGIYFLGHPILLPYLIEDLNTGIWVRSQETGMICALEVVLPKSTAKDGKPVTLLLPGDQYTNRGEWQQLRVKGDVHELEQQAKMLRLELNVPIDTSEAYVRRLILCCYTSGKNSRIWLDNLHAGGIATISPQLRRQFESEPLFNPKNVLWLFRKIGLYRDITTGVSANVETTAVAGENWTLSRNTSPLPTIGPYDYPTQRLVPQELLDETRNKQWEYARQTGMGFNPGSNSQSLRIPNNPIMMVSDNTTGIGATQTAGYLEKPNVAHNVPGQVVNALGNDRLNPMASDLTMPGDSRAVFYPYDPATGPPAFGGNAFSNGANAAFQPGNAGQNTAGDMIPGAPGRTTILPPDQPIARASYEQSVTRTGSTGGAGVGSLGQSSPLISRLSDQPGMFRPTNEGEFPQHVLEDRISRGKPHDGCRITAQQKMLTINGNLPFGVRAVEYRGEPLSFLIGMQFNTIWLSQPPTEALLEEAWELGLWVICPPPDDDTLQRFVNFLNTTGMTDDGKNRADGSGLGVIGRIFARNRNPILAWDIGRNLTLGEVEQKTKRVQLVREADLYRRIPLLCSAESGTRDYSRMVDILLIGRDPILSSLEWNDYDAWLGAKVGWSRPGTPNWCTIQTQPTAAMANQWRLFGTGEIPPAAVSEEHVRMQIRTAMGHECHGLFFTSNSRLDADDPETKYRAALLELVNMELMLVDGWLCAGNSPQVVRSNTAEITGVLLTTDRAKLLLPNITKPFSQYLTGNTNCNDVDFLMPGNFETHEANHIMPGGTRPMTLRRVTGGVQIHFDEVNPTTTAFFAQAEPILRAVIPRSRQPELSRRSAELAITLAKMRLEQVRKTIRAFQEIQAAREGLPTLPDGFPIISMPEQDSMLRETERSISTAESYHRQSDYSSAYQQAQRSIAGLQYYERLKWEEAIRSVPHHNMIPTSVSFVTLPAYIATIKKMYRMKPGENRLTTGDGENAAQWQQAGWLSLSSPTEGVTPAVTVANSAAARSGRGGMQLQLLPTSQIASTAPATGGTTSLVAAGTSENDIIQLETAPVWIRTPQIPVYASETLCITGYVNIPKKLQGNVDGFMIFDSLGGEPLALRLSDTGGQWRQFTFYRAVPSVVPPQASMCVTFALSGLGEVRLDDLQIFPIILDPNAPADTESSQPPASNWPQLPRLDQMWRSQ